MLGVSFGMGHRLDGGGVCEVCVCVCRGGGGRSGHALICKCRSVL